MIDRLIPKDSPPRIGARLLHRTTRRSNLTGEGEIFYERAVRIPADLAKAQNLFAGA